METIIHGNFRSSFSTTMLESKHPDITERKIQVVGRKVIENAVVVDEIPTNLPYWNVGVEHLSAVEIFPYINEVDNTPFSIAVKEIHWFNVKISGEQYIDDVLHGIIKSEVFVKYERKKLLKDKQSIVETTGFYIEQKTTDKINTSVTENNSVIDDIQTNHSILGDDVIPNTTLSTPNSSNKGCLGSFRSGCLGILGLLFLLALLAGLIKNCSNSHGNQDGNTKDNSHQDSTKVEKTDHKNTLETISLPNVQFFTDSDQLLPTSKQDLDALANHLKENKKLNAHIVGHTDDVGGAEKNQVLSLKRALAVKNYLVQNGIAETRLSAEGKGESVPRASNSSLEGRLMNRRVEVQLTESN